MGGRGASGGQQPPPVFVVLSPPRSVRDVAAMTSPDHTHQSLPNRHAQMPNVMLRLARHPACRKKSRRLDLVTTKTMANLPSPKVTWKYSRRSMEAFISVPWDETALHCWVGRERWLSICQSASILSSDPLDDRTAVSSAEGLDYVSV